MEAATGNLKRDQLLKQNRVIIATLDVSQKLHDGYSNPSTAYIGKQLQLSGLNVPCWCNKYCEVKLRTLQKSNVSNRKSLHEHQTRWCKSGNKHRLCRAH